MFISDISIMHAILSLVTNGGQRILITFVTLSLIWHKLIASRLCYSYYLF